MFKFTEDETKIFEYSRGEWDEQSQQYKSIFADPAKIKRQLDIVLPNRNQLIDQYLKGMAVAKSKAAEENPTFTEDDTAAIRMGGIAHQNICAGVRLAFGLLDFDEATGKGCTDYMVVHVFNHYNEWLEKKDGSTPPTPTS